MFKLHESSYHYNQAKAVLKRKEARKEMMENNLN